MLLKLFYRLTGWFPRKLPDSRDEYDHFKSVLVDCFGVPDEPQVWALVAGHITSTPAWKLRKPWSHIANAAKRLAINKLAMEEKNRAINFLKEQLEYLTKIESERVKKELDQNAGSITLDSKIQDHIEVIEDLK